MAIVKEITIEPIISSILVLGDSLSIADRDRCSTGSQKKNMILMLFLVGALFCLFYFKNKLKCQIHSTLGANAIVAAASIASFYSLHRVKLGMLDVSDDRRSMSAAVVVLDPIGRVLSHVYDHVNSVYEVIRKTFEGEKKVKNGTLMAFFVAALFCLFYFKNKLKCQIHSTPGTNAIVAAGTLAAVGILHNLNK